MNASLDAYSSQKSSARKRGIEWLLDFDAWLRIWLASGKFHLRGRGAERYCMARRGDVGPYSEANVEIITNRLNSTQSRTNHPETLRHPAWTQIGRGRGWTLIRGATRDSYQVMIRDKYVGTYATQAEAEAAYRDAAAQRLREIGRAA